MEKMGSAGSEMFLTIILHYLILHFAFHLLKGPTEIGGHWLSAVFIHSQLKDFTVSLDIAVQQGRISEFSRKNKWKTCPL